ncbi:GmrSD restriction endonuclease domain-containing protein [Candidatus Palauibacter sp.]|uniref:GmrSD restriction endonuclease domain-containing protein n=1 Tax=Candidatus Palauibacter sp. TaxID=3101350 RepID=UPI003B5C02FF
MKKKFSSDDVPLVDLLDQAASGELQLPDFQRGWVWDDDHIQSLLASISLSYPIGAVMTLVAGNPCVNFKARLLEGVNLNPRPKPETLLLDGQQRLTSLFQALKSQDPVCTRSSRGKKLLRHYYAKIEACIDPSVDREEKGIVGIPADRIIRSDFGRIVDLDLTTRDREIAAQMFPLDIVFNAGDTMVWQQAYLGSGPGDMAERLGKWMRFHEEVVLPFQQYNVPTIELAKPTPKEAVCQVFEKVNTGGVTLTVFELLTATYAADNFELRKDWEARHQRLSQVELLKKVDATAFLQIVTLLSTYNRWRSHLEAHPEDDKAPAISCKRREVLSLPLEDYKQWADRAERGLLRTVPFLHNQCMFRYRDLPYTTQLVPLAGIFGWLDGRAESYEALQRLGRWFWCGILGEMYGGGTETRFALDLEDCVAWIEALSDSAQPRTVQAAQFQAERLLTLRTRNSAAYKGLHALQMKQGALDFKTGQPIDVHAYMEQAIDIHHVFPRHWCGQHGIDWGVVNCIVNKTALDARTNRRIGGSAPSVYLSRIESGDGIQPHVLDGFLRSHDIDPVALRRDDFGHYFNQRFESLLGHVQRAMSKPVNRRPDRDESPFVQREIDIESGVRSLIETGESAVVEFKSTARFNLHSNGRDEEITWAVIKTIAAFMNTDGGTLLIGVNDRGEPVGIERDYPHVKGADRDGWELWITTAVKNALGSVAATDLPVGYCTIQGRTIARIDVHRGIQPTFASRKGKAREVFFARLNNATEELSGSALLEYRQKHWPQ